MKDACKKCHPDHSKELNRINRLQGQLEGIKKMIADRRYCPEIMIQTRAVAAAVRALEAKLLESHLKHCVAQAFESKSKKDSEDKISELVDLFKR
ncbi:MAG: metal-sensitive transcriptional regulator [bacterium]|nr:metal-sensitive transcriptional regulator [bacterium]MBU1918065.1 metal-sensitive transcriptional regulator [bacterium]